MTSSALAVSIYIYIYIYNDYISHGSHFITPDALAVTIYSDDIPSPGSHLMNPSAVYIYIYVSTLIMKCMNMVHILYTKIINSNIATKPIKLSNSLN